MIRGFQTRKEGISGQSLLFTVCVFYVVGCIRNKVLQFAKTLYDSMHGLGTNDLSLIRTVVSRCEIDMVQIKEEFERAYKQPLGKYIAVSTLNTAYCLPSVLAK